MAVNRVSDRQTFTLFNDRVADLQVQLRTLRDRIATGQQNQTPDEDPIAASTTVQLRSTIGALGAYADSAKFGNDVLSAQFQTLQQAKQLMTRADEIATQQSSGLLSPAEHQAAAEEVHGLLQAMTALGNSTFAGRRLYSGLAQDTTAAPFADPDSVGYDPSTAYTGSTQSFDLKVGDTPQDRVRLTTAGDQVFKPALQGLSDLEQALRSNGDVAGTLAGLKTAEDAISAETASVGARQSTLKNRLSQLSGVTGQEQSALSRVADADLVRTISDLTQTQTALEALLQATGQILQTNLSSLIRF